MINRTKKYCIYAHTSPSGKVYIGQTCQNVWIRWLHNGNGYKYQPYFWKAIQKYGWNNFIHTIILSDVSKLEANYAEKYLIRWYKMHKLSYNITDGGEGTCGSEPWNKGIKTGVVPWNKGIPRSEECKDKISKSKKGHKYGPQSELHREHKAEKHKIPIVMTDIFNPRLHRYFKSAKDAELSNSGFSRKNINRCLKNKCVQAHGYFWFYINNFTIANYYNKYEQYQTARKHYKKETMPEYINTNGINIINCLKPINNGKEEESSSAGSNV